jgi:hypothetical protein
MVDLKCEEIVSRAPWKTRVIGGVLASQCSRLYESSVRNLVKQFRDSGPDNWESLGLELTRRRTAWFEENGSQITPHLEGSEVERAYRLILMKVGIAEKEAPIIEKTDGRLVFHSENPCPALDACKILGFDTRVVCRLHSEEATDALIKKLNPKLKFTRNYARLRPYSPFCEEIIEIQRDDPTQGE